MKRKFLVLSFFLALVAAGAFFWAGSSTAAKLERATLPTVAQPTTTAFCDGDYTDPPEGDFKEVTFSGLGTYQETGIGKATQIMARVKPAFISKSGLKTVPLEIVSIGGRTFAEGIGETRFWLDATRPVPSAIWEKRPGTEFPAVQEMRFHFFYTLEALPGRVFRSINPAIMRSNNVRAFPPLSGTRYHLVQPVEIEDVSDPGVVVGKVLSNEFTVGRHRSGLRPEVLEN
jgi:hypothetical protein